MQIDAMHAAQILVTGLAALGCSAVIVTPARGPAAWVRERQLRPIARRLGGEGLVDCLLCTSVWCGAGLAVLAMLAPNFAALVGVPGVAAACYWIFARPRVERLAGLQASAGCGCGNSPVTVVMPHQDQREQAIATERARAAVARAQERQACAAAGPTAPRAE